MKPPAVHPFLPRFIASKSSAQETPSPAGRLDWDSITREAITQGVGAIFHNRLQETGLHSQVSPSLLDHLRTYVFSLATRNLAASRELASILQGLQAGGVACLPIRGLALSEQLYGDLTARPTGDLDLLVRREALPDTARILRAQGFSEIDRRPGFARSYSHTLEFCKDSGRAFLVEPHWTIAYPPFADRIDMSGVWARRRTGPFLGMDTSLLGDEDSLLHLCFHLIHKHDGAPLLWLYDLHCLIRQRGNALDWPLIALNAARSGRAALVCEILGRVRSLFETPIPDEIFSRLTAPSTASVERPAGSFTERLAERVAASTSPLEVRESLSLLLTIKGARAKLRYVLAILFPSPDFMRLQYCSSNGVQLSLHYLARACTFTWQGLRGIGSVIGPRKRY
jgi:hypothetical protein